MTIRLVSILASITFTVLFLFSVTMQAQAIHFIPFSSHKNELYKAIEKGNEPSVQKLLLKMSDKSKRKILNTRRGLFTKMTPLFFAVSKGYIGVAQRLIENGADVNQSIQFGLTPLHSASTYGQIDIVKLLLDHGANIHITDKLYKQTSLHKAVTEGHVEIVRLLAQKGASPNQMDRFKITPLDYCKRHKGDLAEDLKNALDPQRDTSSSDSD